MKFERFRLAILGGFLLIAGLVLGATVLLVSRRQTAEIQSEIRRNLRTAQGMFNHFLKLRGARTETNVRLLGADFAFKKLLMTRDPATIESGAYSLRDRIDADVVWILDEKGILYGDTTGRLKAGQSLADVPAIQGILEGKASWSSIQILDGQAFQISAVSVKAPLPIGILAAGFRFDDKSAAELKLLIGADLSFGFGGRIAASTLPSAARKRLEEGLVSVAAGWANALGPRDDLSLVWAEELSPDITAYLQSSLNEALEPARALTRLLVVIGLPGLGLTVLAGFLVTNKLTRSMQELMETTERLNEELAQTNRFQSQVFTVVAHDVTNPLSAAIGFAYVLKNQLSDPDQMKCIEGITRSMDALHFLISDLVDFAAIETGKLRVNLEPINPLAFFREIHGRMAVVAQKRKIALEAVMPDALPRVRGDARRLAQALQNLCSNAINYTQPNGSIELRADLEPGKIKFSVKDSGIGISAEDLPKIFNRFFQAENARKHRGAGFGLGLKISREIIEAHGGSIGVASVLGEGSTFYFTIPVLAEAAPPAAALS